MKEKPLEERRKALEEDFFRRESEAKLAKLRAKKEREALAAATGVADGELVERLHALGVRAESLEALVHAPLVSVAWADGKLDPEERSAVREAADAAGLRAGTAPRALLERWLDEPPGGLFDAWERFLTEAWRGPRDAARRRAVEELLRGRLRDVAVASGGFDGLGRISRAEADALVRVMRAFLESREPASGDR
ncbi:MAG TPA: TerB family tellurite resistance protein [Myxococcota bacterium]|jgi:tellurite resistance protein|nr:TerB family tellurite resistance protein [Myxococcota bacterium]